MAGISCPYCHCNESTLVTRTVDETESKRRYRKCIACGKSFPTLEQIDPKKLEQIQRTSEPPTERELKRAKERMQKLTGAKT